MRVLQFRRDPDLAQEAFGTQAGGYLRVEDLDGDLAPVPDIIGQVDHRHPAAAELALDRVTVGKGCFQALKLFGHGLG
jgi:hypothetical protein